MKREYRLGELLLGEYFIMANFNILRDARILYKLCFARCHKVISKAYAVVVSV